jgi:hypothetical protein
MIIKVVLTLAFEALEVTSCALQPNDPATGAGSVRPPKLMML